MRRPLLPLALIGIVHGALIASSRLEQCYNDGKAPLDCAHRIVVALAIA